MPSIGANPLEGKNQSIRKHDSELKDWKILVIMVIQRGQSAVNEMESGFYIFALGQGQVR